MFDASKAFSGFSVDDVAAAKSFYGDTLGLDVSEENGLLWLRTGQGSGVLAYPKPDHTPASLTILNFTVARGDEGPPIAWFTDPASNVLAVLEEG